MERQAALIRGDLQDRLDGRSIGRSPTYVVQADDSLGVNQYVPAELIGIAGRRLPSMPLPQQFRIAPPGRRPPDIPPVPPFHPIGCVQSQVFIDQDRPGQLRFLGIRPRQGEALKRHHHDLHAKVVKFRFVLPQLRQVIPTGQSSQMAVENQQ